MTLNGTGISSGGALVNSSGSTAQMNGTVTLASNSSFGGVGDIIFDGSIRRQRRLDEGDR